MLEPLLPSFAACVETRRDLLDIELFPSEVETLGRAVEKRRREFVTGRACARLALEQLGVAPAAIPGGAGGAPVWPAGVVGSITHCRGFRAAAVARATDALALGIDAEPDEPLPPGVLEEVAHGPELDVVAAGGPGADAGRLLFTAKEAVYKAWFPLTGRWLGFEDARVSLDGPAGTFRAELLVPAPRVAGVALSTFAGRWSAAGGVICATVVVSAP